MFTPAFILLLFGIAAASPVEASEDDSRATELPIGRIFSTKDTIPAPKDASADAVECLKGLCWKAESFEVRCKEPIGHGTSAILRFPSAKPTGNARNDLVAVEWYAPANSDENPPAAPAIVVVHESGRSMNVGKMIARGLRDRGIHAFMVQLPFYGLRKPHNAKAEDQDFATVMSQGIADVRRTLDVVRVLPGVQPANISLQGTSLGGFVAATAGGLDAAFENNFVLLAGGNLPQLVVTGARETAQLRQLLEKQGFKGPAMVKLLNRFEPNRLAHRIPADRLWVYSGNFDTVVPPVHAESFAKAAGIAESHHIRMPATHISGLVFLPIILDQISAECGGKLLLKAE